MDEERNGKCLEQVEDIRGHLWHRYSIAVNQVAVAQRKIFEVMTNVHQPNRFRHKQIVWYDYPHFPHKKEEMTRTTSGQNIFKGE
jgi:hypothetical protein